MKNRLPVVIAVLLAAMLACNLPIPGDNIPGLPPIAEITIQRITVNPPAGSGSFTLEVTYSAIRGMDPGSIHCNYVTPDSATLSIGVIEQNPEGRILATFSEQLPFDVTQKDGKIVPGVYLAGCWTDTNPKLVTTPFTVTEDATQTPTPTPAVTPTATQPFVPAATPTSAPTPTFTPVTVKGAGREIYTDGFSNNVNCTIPVDFSLSVEADGRAELSITASSDIDRVYSTNFTECFWRPNNYTFTVSSYADLGGKTVTFNRTDNPRLCDGIFSYAGGVLSGEFLCSSGFNSTEYGMKFVIP